MIPHSLFRFLAALGIAASAEGAIPAAHQVLPADTIAYVTTPEWNKSAWESTLDIGLRTLHLVVDTHAITSHFALPLLIKTPGGLVVEVNDGTAEYNAANYRVSFFYDLAKASVNRTAFALAHELQPHARVRPSSVGPSRRSRKTPTCRAGTEGRCPSSKSRTQANLPT